MILLYENNEWEVIQGNIIGVPNDNTKIYILDPQERLCPIGVSGEICVTGNQLARGYINEKKDANFKESVVSNKKIYKTGDYARWLNNGKIEFLGRKDTQVKIRGHRIELHEIESIIEDNPLVENAIVLYKAINNNEKELIAYIKGQENLNLSKLKEEISIKLPNHMIPSYFLTIKEFPITANGKIAINDFPLPRTNETRKSLIFNETEQIIEGIWQSILSYPNIDLDDNFFDLGGNSIKVMIMARLIKEAFEVIIPVVDLYKYNTIKLLSLKINQANTAQIKTDTIKIESSLVAIQNTIRILNNLDSNDEKL
ncbi:non-ribosomal peptide synthetase [Flavobacterium geliluteum]|uniref:Non-ribosomal peptide synthetase n=1 Tax=Flavobacterium geliluteum TaxID=2816120 RepID=A0A940X5V5_9FLAO|nr:non-ribosomal peptide synthetase [Flavobacterium geliluteum]MBP4137059.1 non-ribosomal peptide synthetase [Flavobacterium geliluteum]